MSILRRKEFFVVMIVLISVFIYIPYFFEVPQVMTNLENWFMDTIVIIAAFAVWVGFITSTRREVVRIQRRRKGWYYAVIILVLSWLMVIIGLGVSKTNVIFEFLQYAFVLPGDSTIYAILVFYLTSSGARAFRVNSLESALLTFGALFVLLKQAPLGEVLAPWAGPVAIYLQDTIAMAATRVFNVSMAVGSVVLAIRLMLGQEMALVGLVRRIAKRDEN
jgi:uncharacterized membrane protein